MIDEINGEIAKLESQPASYQNIERLAWLYIVRDHLTVSPASPAAGNDIPQGESEYYCACAGKSVSEIMTVMDELMSVLMITQPRLYSAVLTKLNPV